MSIDTVDFKEKLALFDEFWAPRIVAQLNDYHLKLAKIQGEFVWHSHPETDEAFIVIEGAMQIVFRDQIVDLEAGQLCVVPSGVEHKPVASQTCHLLLIEPADTLNTGDAGGERTRTEELWI